MIKQSDEYFAQGAGWKASDKVVCLDNKRNVRMYEMGKIYDLVEIEYGDLVLSNGTTGYSGVFEKVST